MEHSFRVLDFNVYNENTNKDGSSDEETTSEPNSQLTDFCLDQQVEYHFLFSPAKVGVLQDAFKRYGTDLAGLVKLVQRTSGIGYARDATAIIAMGVKACGEQTNSAAYGPGYSSM